MVIFPEDGYFFSFFLILVKSLVKSQPSIMICMLANVAHIMFVSVHVYTFTTCILYVYCVPRISTRPLQCSLKGQVFDV